MKKIIYIYLLLTISITSCKTPIYKNKTDVTNINAVWVYSIEKDDNNTLLDNIQYYGFNTAFVSVSPVYLASPNYKAYQNKVLDFLKKAKDKNIAVHVLICEQPSYTKTENHNKALREINKTLAFFRRNPENIPVSIQIDIEPHTLPEWKESNDFNNGVQEELVSQWLELHKKISEKINKTNIQFSSVITWWYDSKFRNGELPSGDTKLISQYVDFIVVMAFAEVTPPYIQAEDECNIVKTIVATNSTLYNSYNSFESVRKQIDIKLSGNSNYLGQSVFHLGIIPE